jgi:hypothetical protein
MNIELLLQTALIVFGLYAVIEYRKMQILLGQAQEKSSCGVRLEPGDKCKITVSQNEQDKIVEIERCQNHE